ncbi:MAG: CBS domain-containing protein [Candidatus Thermoplasmatota archaeon]|nr:CBS domain-containing protein [Candidatus Thermoplasmatota archaeon]
MNVSDIMVKDPIKAELPITREEVLSLLVKHKRTGMPVVDSDGRVLGVITRKDIFENPGEEQVAVIMEWDVPTVSPSATVEKAARTMWEENARRLPVVKKNELVGLLTPSDLLRVIEKNRIEKPVEEFISKPTVCIYKKTPANVAAMMINLSKVYALPVLDEGGKICGLVTDRDLFDFKFLGENITLTTLGISEDEDSWTWEGLRNVMNLYYQEAKIQLPSDPIEEFMAKDLSTVYRLSPVWEAAKLMRLKDFDQVPIVDKEDNLFAMVYDMDLMKSLFE